MHTDAPGALRRVLSEGVVGRQSFTSMEALEQHPA
jgi:hypothetical protein